MGFPMLKIIVQARQFQMGGVCLLDRELHGTAPQYSMWSSVCRSGTENREDL